MQSSTEELTEAPKHSLALGDTNPDAPAEETGPLGGIILLGLLALLFFAAGRSVFFLTLGLIFMIFLHEAGHFFTARWTGMKATQFFLGFGKTIWSFRRGETTYGVKAIPAGAFVRILGMHNLDPVEPEDEPRAYRNATYPRRMLVITAGSMMHFLQSIVLFVLLFAVIGLEEVRTDEGWTVFETSSIDEDGEILSPAQIAGIQSGDVIQSIGGQDVTDWEDLSKVVGDSPGETFDVTGVRADGTQFSVSLTLAARPTDETRGFLGVRPEFPTETVKPGAWEGVKEFGNVMYQSTVGLPQIFSPSTSTELVNQSLNPSESSVRDGNRPISIFGIIGLANDVNPLILLAYVNAFVGLFNLLPLLPLDGGHAVIATYERIRSRKGQAAHHADFAKAMPLVYPVIAFLGFLFLTTVWLDVFELFSS